MTRDDPSSHAAPVRRSIVGTVCVVALLATAGSARVSLASVVIVCAVGFVGAVIVSAAAGRKEWLVAGTAGVGGIVGGTVPGKVRRLPDPSVVDGAHLLSACFLTFTATVAIGTAIQASRRRESSATRASTDPRPRPAPLTRALGELFTARGAMRRAAPVDRADLGAIVERLRSWNAQEVRSSEPLTIEFSTGSLTDRRSPLFAVSSGRVEIVNHPASYRAPAGSVDVRVSVWPWRFAVVGPLVALTSIPFLDPDHALMLLAMSLVFVGVGAHLSSIAAGRILRMTIGALSARRGDACR